MREQTWIGVFFLMSATAMSAAGCGNDVQVPTGGSAGVGGGGTGSASTGSAGGTEGNDQVGPACRTVDDLDPNFAGFNVGFLTVEIGDPSCVTGVCIVDHFQGRVTCPYGQTEEEIQSLPASAGARCRVNGAMGWMPVTVPVAPQLLARRAEQVVYCSCECDGPPSPDKSYCTCPSGFACTAFDKVNQTDFYCMKQSVAFDPSTLGSSPPVCDKDPSAPEGDCGNGRQNP